MKAIRGAMLAMMVLSTPALAQFSPSFPMGGEKEVTEEEKARMKSREDAAKAATARIPAPKASNDPWANARDVPAPPAAAPARKSK